VVLVVPHVQSAALLVDQRVGEVVDREPPVHVVPEHPRQTLVADLVAFVEPRVHAVGAVLEHRPQVLRERRDRVPV
jgi:hypothetical protein